jgi:hypothetical protein
MQERKPELHLVAGTASICGTLADACRSMPRHTRRWEAWRETSFVIAALLGTIVLGERVGS